jgi:hypothetical protein
MSSKKVFMRDSSFHFKKGKVITDGRKHLMVMEAEHDMFYSTYTFKKLSKRWYVRLFQIAYLKIKL